MEVGIVILISHKADLKSKQVKKDEEGYYIQGTFHHGDITVINTHELCLKV